MGFVAGGTEGLGGERGARARAAVEHDGAVAIDRRGLSRELIELDVERALDAPHRVLVVLANIHQLGPGGHQLSGLLGGDLVLDGGAVAQSIQKVAQDPVGRADRE